MDRIRLPSPRGARRRRRSVALSLLVAFTVLDALGAGRAGGLANAAASADAGPPEPQSGAWFGAYVETWWDGYGGTDVAALSVFESDVNRKMAIQRTYRGWNDVFPNAEDEISRDQGRTLFLSWKPTVPWREIARGDWNGLIDARADDLRRFGAPLYLSFHHEPEDDTSWAGTSLEFIDAFRHVRTRMLDRGVTNVDFVLTLMAPTLYWNKGNDWYPGGEHVDALAADGYNWFGCRQGIEGRWRSFEQVFTPFVTWGEAKGKPLIVAEFGSGEDPQTPGRKADWIRDAAAAIQRWPSIKAVSYFNTTVDETCDWELNSSPSALEAFATAGADPYFNPPPPTVLITAPAGGLTNSRAATVTFQGSYAPLTYTCSLDGGPALLCASGHTYQGLTDGLHAVSVVATDLEGNRGPAFATWTVDATAPTAVLESTPPPLTNETTARFQFASNEAGGTFSCRLDGGAWADCTSPTHVTGVADGTHVFEVKAIDVAGNHSVPATSTWVQDTVAPLLTLVGGPPALTNVATWTWDFSTSEPATFKCSKDDGAFYLCSSPFTWSDMPSGDHSLSVYADDPAGNRSAVASQSWTVDTIRPSLTVVSAPPLVAPETTATFVFTVDDPSAVVGCALDGAAPVPCSSPAVYTDLAPGGHAWTVYATDHAGNVGTATHTWSIDLDRPTVSLDTRPGPITSSTSVKFGFSSNEPGTFRCRVDLAAWVDCTSPTTVSGLADGLHVFEVKAVDRSGTESLPAVAEWIQDTKAPTLALSAGPPAFVNLNTWTWTFTTNEPSQFKCRRDSGTYQTCSSPFVWTWMNQGAHTLSVYALDAAGNRSNVVTQSWTVDTTRPTVSITSPGVGAVVSGTTAVKVSASDSGGIAKVEVLVDGLVVGSDATSPYQVNWNTSTALDGPHALTAKAYDRAGNLTVSLSVVVTVSNRALGPLGRRI